MKLIFFFITLITITVIVIYYSSFFTRPIAYNFESEEYRNASKASKSVLLNQTNITISGITWQTLHPVLKRLQNPSNCSGQCFFLLDFEIRFKNTRLNYTVEFAKACQPKTKLLILTLSPRNGFERRHNIRQTWMKNKQPGQNQRFLIADKAEQDEDPNVAERLKREQAENRDLLTMHGFADQYKHLHLKLYAGLQWQQTHCAGAEWVLKADDDVILNLAKLDHWIGHKFGQIANEHNQLVFIGRLLANETPHREPENKWYVPESAYSDDRYPDFVRGGVYLGTTETIAAILAHTAEVNELYLEDLLYTGVLAERAGVFRSDQKQHIVERPEFDEHPDTCEGGTPTVFAILSTFGQKENEQQFEERYKKLTIKCKDE